MKTSIWESKIFTHLPLMFSMITFLGGVFLIFDISVKNIIDIIVTHKAVFLGIFLLVLSITLFCAKEIYRFLLNFIRSPVFNIKDSILISVFVFAILYGLLLKEEKSFWVAILIPLILLFLLYFIKAILKYSKQIQHEDNPTSHVFFDIYGTPEPIVDPSKDILERSTFAKRIASLVIEKPEMPIVYGINGEWGSGKTSLVNLVFFYIDNEKYDRITFSSWNYREPQKIVISLFSQIKSILSKYCEDPLTMRLIAGRLSKLVNGVGIGPFSFNVKNTLNLSDGEKKRLLSLPNYNKQLIVFLDDLDRLDSNELHAVLRTVKVLSDIPKIKFILAYDKTLIFKILFENNDIETAKDYLGKIVNIEFNLAIASTNLRIKLLKKALLPIHRYLSVSDNEMLFNLDSKLVFHIFCSLKTPREIQRIAAIAGFIYSLHDDTYNFCDLLLLTIIQYRAPDVYRRLQDNRDKIVALLQAIFLFPIDNPEAYAQTFNRENADSKGSLPTSKENLREYCNSFLCKNTDPHTTTLLNELFFIALENNDPIKGDAILSERRFCHPFVHDAYFQYVHPDKLGEIEKLCSALGEQNKNESINDFESIFKKGKYRALLLQPTNLNYIINKAMTNNKNTLYNLIKEITSIVSKTSGNLSDSHPINGPGEKMEFAKLTHNLISTSLIHEVKDSLLNLLTEIINGSTSFGFSAYLYRASVDPSHFRLKRYIIFSENDKNSLTNLIQKKCQDYLSSEELFGDSIDDINGVINWTPLNNEIINEIYSGLELKPSVIWQILSIYTSVGKLESSDSAEVLGNQLNKLDLRISCRRLYDFAKSNIIMKEIEDSVKIKQYKLLEEYVRGK